MAWLVVRVARGPKTERDARRAFKRTCLYGDSTSGRDPCVACGRRATDGESARVQAGSQTKALEALHAEASIRELWPAPTQRNNRSRQAGSGGRQPRGYRAAFWPGAATAAQIDIKTAARFEHER